MTCRIALTIDGLSKQVIQLEKGRQSKELKALAEAVFSGVEDEAEKGIQAESLSDGLEKIARETLAPETFHLMIHRKPDPGADASERGWLMRINGLSVSTRVFVPGQGYQEPVERVLSPKDLSALIAELQTGNPQGLPTNLYAEKYTDFSLRVLNREKKLQARRFAGMTPTTHGARQQDFDGIFRVLSELHGQTIAPQTN